ncbi:hypothetical protein [Lacrimispora amygdalina]|nr:hypothetical protein [Lacrimispora amygdalina]MDK2967066.1 hypothetical protein [Lacrimispora sp.]
MTIEEKMKIAMKEGEKSLEYGELPVGARFTIPWSPPLMVPYHF